MRGGAKKCGKKKKKYRKQYSFSGRSREFQKSQFGKNKKKKIKASPDPGEVQGTVQAAYQDAVFNRKTPGVGGGYWEVLSKRKRKVKRPVGLLAGVLDGSRLKKVVKRVFGGKEKRKKTSGDTWG